MVKRFARLPYQTTPRLSSVSGPLIAIPIYGDLMHTNGSPRDGSNHFPTRSLTLIFLVSIPTCKAIVCTFLQNVCSHSHLEWHSLVEVDPACRFLLSNIYLLQWSLNFISSTVASNFLSWKWVGSHFSSIIPLIWLCPLRGCPISARWNVQISSAKRQGDRLADELHCDTSSRGRRSFSSATSPGGRIGKIVSECSR